MAGPTVMVIIVLQEKIPGKVKTDSSFQGRSWRRRLLMLLQLKKGKNCADW